MGSTLLLPLAVFALPVLAGDGIDLDSRVGALEARLESLTRRVTALESVLKASDPDATAALSPKGAPAWYFDGYVQGSPFRVLQQELDRATGRVDLLLDLVAPLPDPEQWTAEARGQQVPLGLVAEPADLVPGTPVAPVPLVLERAARVAPGARLHLSARLDPAEARSVRRIRVARAGSDAAETR